MSDDTEPNTPLLLSAKAGRTEAFEKLLAVYRPRLLARAARELPGDLQGKVSPSDVVQESLLAACKGFGEFRGESQAEFAVWLQRIYLRHLWNFVDHYRNTQMRNTSREAPIPVAQLPCRTGGPVVELTREEERASRLALIDLLPEMPRRVVRLRIVEDVGFEEIAQQTGQSLEAVRRMWSRAILQLRDLKRPAGKSDDSA